MRRLPRPFESASGFDQEKPVQQRCFRLHRMLPEFVWDASVLEGNPFTYPEVKTLLDGVTIGGHKLSDQEQVLNLAAAARRLLDWVKSGDFAPDKLHFCDLHARIARNEALEWGHFRGEGQETGYTPDVGLGEAGRYSPLPTVPGAAELNRVFSAGINALNALPSPRRHADTRPVQRLARPRRAASAARREWRQRPAGRTQGLPVARRLRRALLSGLRDERGQGPRAAQCGRRHEAGAAPHPVLDARDGAGLPTPSTSNRRAWSAT
jgi:hypothetical protein